MSVSSETSDHDIIVLIDVGNGSVKRTESSDLLAVLFELDSDALSDG